MSTIVTRWWWIRHAPVINPGGRIYGQGDVPADCSNRPAFAALAQLLPRDAVWLTTPLRRTRETFDAVMAERAPDARPGEPVAEPAFLEQHLGQWQGLTHDEVAAQLPEGGQRFWVAPASARPPGGESFGEVYQRVAEGVERLGRQHAGADVVVFAHGGPIRAAVGLALGLEPEPALRVFIANLSVTRLDQIVVPETPAQWRVSAVNAPPVPGAATGWP